MFMQGPPRKREDFRSNPPKPKVKASLRKSTKAFTRIDLTAVVAVIAILAPLFLFASASSQERARIARCKNNLRQIETFLRAYANDHDDFLPANRAGNWPFDMDREIMDLMGEYGFQSHVLYCPSGVSESPDIRLNFTQDFAIVDYVLTLSDGFGAGQGLSFTNVNEKIIPEPIRIRDEVYLPTASERELATDAVISDRNDKETARFVGIVGGSPVPYRTIHLQGERPTGANIVFLDGHIEWRNFTDSMTVRSTLGYPFFWY